MTEDELEPDRESTDEIEFVAVKTTTKAAAHKPASVPPAVPASVPPGNAGSAIKTADALNLQFMGLLRDIRAEVQDLRVSFAELKEAQEAKADERGRKIAAAWSGNKGIIDAGVKSINLLFLKFSEEIYRREPGGAEIYDYYGDEVTRIYKKWRRYTASWEHYGNTAGEVADHVADHVADMDKLLCEIIFIINGLTIPDRVNEHFATLYPGQELDFWKMFGDELCRKEDALPILEDIQCHPACIHGVVDTAKGKIYKVDPRRWRRFASFLITALLGAAGFVIAYFLPRFLFSAGYPLSITIPAMNISGVSTTMVDFSAPAPVDPVVLGYMFCAVFLLIIAGGLAHLLIGGIKQVRSAEPGSVLAVEGWICWFHIMEVKNWAAVISLIIGFAGMIFILKTADYATAFFVGYSIDSFVDLFLARFDVAATTKTAEIKKLIPSE
jgi:hypothetical protein